MGFNCVRFTWSTQQVKQRHTMTLSKSFEFMSPETRDAFVRLHGIDDPDRERPWSFFQRAIDVMLNRIPEKPLMVVLDNHISSAQWCCSPTDGNRWWGERNFPADEWLASLTFMAGWVRERGYWHVIGMGLRNEIDQGPLRHGEKTWFQYMRRGSVFVYEANPDLLVIVSGMTSGSYLKMLHKQPFVTEDMPQALNKRIVYEAHYYNLFYIRPFWFINSYEKACQRARNFLDKRTAFLLSDAEEPTAPLFFSEFGLDTENYHSSKHKDADTKWLKCVTKWMDDRDIDFGYWVLNSVYYTRQGKKDYHESWGLLKRKQLDAGADDEGSDRAAQDPKMAAEAAHQQGLKDALKPLLKISTKEHFNRAYDNSKGGLKRAYKSAKTSLTAKMNVIGEFSRQDSDISPGPSAAVKNQNHLAQLRPLMTPNYPGAS